MIWQSTFLMSVIDVLIIALAAGLALLLARHYEAARALGLAGAIRLIVFGLAMFALFHAVDLGTMFVLPVLTSPAHAMRAMTDLHLNWAWVSSVIGLGVIAVGASLLITRLVPEARRSIVRLEQAVQQRTAELEQTNAALIASESRFRDILDIGSDWVWECDADFRLTYFSEQFADVTGMSSDDAIGKTGAEIMRANGVSFVGDADAKQEFLRLLAAHEPFRNQQYFRYVPGRGVLWFAMNGKPVFDGDTFRGYRGTGTDITASKQAELALQQSEEHYRTLVLNAPVCIHEIDLQGRIASMNPAGLQMMGVASGSEVVGMDYLDAVEDKSRRRVGKLMLDAQAGAAVDFDFVSAGDRPRVLYSNFIPIRNRAGNVEKLMGVTQDITARSIAENELRRSEERFRDIVGISSDWVWETDAQGRFFEITERIVDFTDVYPDSWLGRSATEIIATSDDIEFIGNRAVRREYITALKQRQPFKHMQYSRADARGKMRYAEISGKPIWDSDNSFYGYRGTGTDITDIKSAEVAVRASEEKYRLLVEAVQVIPWEMDDSLNFSYVGPQGTAILGYSQQELLSDGFWPAHLHADDKARVLRQSRAATQRGYSYELEYRIRAAAGHYVWMRDVVSTLLDARGRLTLRGISIDISERKEQELQLAQALKMDAVGQLTSGIAHDFNNLLTVIFGNLNLLDEEIAELQRDDLQEIVSDALSAASDGSELTKRLLGFSRKQPVQSRYTRVGAKLLSLRSMLQRTIGADIRLHFDLQHDGWTNVDPVQFETSVLNLVVNARDAMPNGGTLRFTTVTDEAADGDLSSEQAGYIALRVQDSGTGMSPDVLSHATEPFFTTKPAGEGTGLGLSTVYGFARQSNGELHIASEEGHGTAVTLKLPLVLPPDIEAATEDQLSEVLSGTENVLVVEDRDDVRRFAVRCLRSYGYTVSEAASADAALELIDDSVKLVFSDIRLPGTMNGRALAAKLSRQYPGLRLLLTTASETTPPRQDPAPADLTVLKKPYSRAQLLQSVRAAIDA